MKTRRGFTLTELLIVVAILLLLSTISLTVYNANRSSDRVRSAARVAQSAFLGAKDRAMNAKTFRGLRLTRDQQRTDLLTGFAYIQPIPHDPCPAGSFTLERDAAGNVNTLRSVGSKTDWASVSKFFAVPNQIRIPSGTGQWYQFSVQGPGVLQLSVPYSGNVENPAPAVVASSTLSADIQFGYEVIPFHQPMPLSAGVVIDLNYCSQSVQSLAANGGNIDIIFSPRGTVGGPVGGSGSLVFCLRFIDDAVNQVDLTNPNNASDVLMLTVNPQTGLVQTYSASFEDKLTNATGLPPADGIVDDLFGYVRAGKAAGR